MVKFPVLDYQKMGCEVKVMKSRSRSKCHKVRCLPRACLVLQAGGGASTLSRFDSFFFGGGLKTTLHCIYFFCELTFA